MIRKRWTFRNDKVTKNEVMRTAQNKKIPMLIANILLNRNIESSDIATFMAKSKRDIINPMEMLGMDKATERIIKGIKNKDKMVIYGDYDVDGITSTALLYDFLKSAEADIIYYIPDRKDEGYGINIMAVNKLIRQGMKLLITVDCGITAIGEVEFAKLQGMDVIITDHHFCKERIPNVADAIVNPKQPEDDYPFDGLAGVGVAFKLVLALAMKMGIKTGDVFDRYVDLATVGTIADVVPLVNENRIIVDKGLKMMQEPKRPGIRELLKVAGMSGKAVTSATIAFSVAPRLNAAGRLGTAVTAVELMLTKEDDKAREIAKSLNEENKLRQETEQQIDREALDMIAADANFSKKKVIVLAKENWHNGVIGIVASRIMERFYKPTILISLTNGVGKGSGRSIEGFNLFDGLSACDGLLTTFGGHAAAAGLSINEGDIDNFTEQINKYADEVISDEMLLPVVKIDCLLGGANLNTATAKLLSRLEPYGMGNEKPVFAIKNAVVTSISVVGNEGKHLRMQIDKDGIRVNCIGFGMGEYARIIAPGDGVHLAFRFDINVYRGNESVQLVLNDIKIV